MNNKTFKRIEKEKITNPIYREYWINIIRQPAHKRNVCNVRYCINEQRRDTIFCHEHQQQYEQSRYYDEINK